MIAIQLGEYVVGPGGGTTGRIQWRTDDKAPKEVNVRVRMETEGRGDTDQLILLDSDFPGAQSGSVEITFQIPQDAPCSYDGQLIRVGWFVDVRLKLPWASDERMSLPFQVG